MTATDQKCRLSQEIRPIIPMSMKDYDEFFIVDEPNERGQIFISTQKHGGIATYVPARSIIRI